jgi:hypothetical protein
MGRSEQGGEADRAAVPDARQICFVVDLVDGLAQRAGFDPEELIDPRTGASFGPFLARVKAALLVRAAVHDEPHERR